LRYIIAEVSIMSRKAESEWEQLVALRKNQGLKQEQMAQILGVSLVTYKRWETNIFSPDYETLGRIADYFHVSTDYLLGRSTPNQLTPADRENLAAAAETITDILAKTEVSQNENNHENEGKKKDDK
jgi:transcriptional regulator with XRE-family HTH domain